MRLGAATLVVTLAATTSWAQRTALETENLRLIYLRPTQTYLSPHVARCFENSLAFQRRFWEYEPSQKMTVVLNDFGDGGNAAAGAVPRNFLMLETSPLSLAYETVAPNERMNWLMNHELVHITMMDQPARGDRVFRGLFSGKVTPIQPHPESILYFYLTAPRAAAPRWYQEGIAVFVETWMAGGLGRAQGSWDEMVFRSKVRDDARFYDPVGLAAEGAAVDFQVGVNNYLYGTRFMTWLAYHYSPEQLIRWVSRRDGTKRYYATQFKQVFERTLEDAWDEWISWEHEFQKANLERIRQYPITPSEDISPRALGSVSRAYLDEKKQVLYAGLNYPGVVGHLGAISLQDGSVERLVDVKQPSIFTVTSLAWDPASRTLFFTNDNHAFRDLMAFEPDTGRSRTLMKDARVGELVFDRVSRTLWGVRHFNGIASLVRMPEPWTEWERVYSLPYGDVIYDLDVSPDGRLLSASMGGVDGKHSLQVFEIEQILGAEPVAIARHSFEPALPLNFAFSPDGRYLYGSSYYSGVSNLFRFEHTSGDLQAVSNTDTGLFRPIPLGDDRLIAFRYTGEGFVPTRLQATPIEDVNAILYLGEQLTEKHPIVKDWIVGSPAAVPLDDLKTGEAPYRSVASMRLESIYPVVLGYKDSAGPGLRFNLSDPAFLNRLGVSVAYTPDSDLPSEERFHAHVDYQRYDWKFDFKWNGADFYDLVGPTKRSRKGWSVRLGHTSTLIFDEPRNMELNLEGTVYGDMDQLPYYQNIAVEVDTLFELAADLSYSNLRHSLGHVDEEKGHAWRLVASNEMVDEVAYPKAFGTFDIGVPFGPAHSSLFLRSGAGFSVKDRDDPFANFFFGGFGNNYVDFRTEKRYREPYAFPGAELNEIGGRNFVRSTLEWNLPPLRFESVGNSAIYLSWARAALFTSGIVTNLDHAESRRSVGNVGAQLDLRLNLLSRLDMTLSAGYALAFEDGRSPGHEVMVSLKVLQ